MRPRFLKIANTFLLILIIITTVYIISSPFLIKLFKNDVSNTYSQESKVSKEISNTVIKDPVILNPNQNKSKERPPADKNNADPNFNITMSSLNLNSKLFTSTSSKDLNKGIWHRSSSGNPLSGGNMVITAHRFLYTGNNNTFYNLPNIKLDDTIVITWEGKQYDYKVTNLFEVTPDAVEIEAPTEEHILTLYTCTPLWTSAKRFVVQAKPIL
jgi:LPXTG-site transpeptidase (sortase) family protein